jgi:hypothetical protein
LLLIGIYEAKIGREGRVMLAIEGIERGICASTAFPSIATLSFYAFKHFSDLYPKLF